MARFLIRVTFTRLLDRPEAEQAEILHRERAAGRRLVADGTIEHVWRVPGLRGQLGVWSAPDAETLHAIIAALPIFGLASFDVTPLADHPLMGASDGDLPAAVPAM